MFQQTGHATPCKYIHATHTQSKATFQQPIQDTQQIRSQTSRKFSEGSTAQAAQHSTGTVNISSTSSAHQSSQPLDDLHTLTWVYGKQQHIVCRFSALLDAYQTIPWTQYQSPSLHDKTARGLCVDQLVIYAQHLDKHIHSNYQESICIPLACSTTLNPDEVHATSTLHMLNKLCPVLAISKITPGNELRTKHFKLSSCKGHGMQCQQ